MRCGAVRCGAVRCGRGAAHVAQRSTGHQGTVRCAPCRGVRHRSCHVAAWRGWRSVGRMYLNKFFAFMRVADCHDAKNRSPDLRAFVLEHFTWHGHMHVLAQAMGHTRTHAATGRWMDGRITRMDGRNQAHTERVKVRCTLKDRASNHGLHARMQPRMHARTHARTRAQPNAQPHARSHAHSHAHTHAATHACAHAEAHLQLHARSNAHTHTTTHARTQPRTHQRTH